MKSVGIDLGSQSIKLVDIQLTSKGYQINQFLEHRLSAAVSADHDLETIEFLREVLKKYDPSQTKFVLGLRQDKVALRHKVFPFNDRNKINKSLAFELEEDLPFSFENAIFDAKTIRTHGASAEVIATAAPKTQVQKAVQNALDFGVDLDILSAESAAFSNTIERWSEPPAAWPALALQLEGDERPQRNIQILLNIGHTHTLVTAFESNAMIGARSIPWGGKNIAEAIAKKYEIPYFEAVREVETKAFVLLNKQGATFDQITFSDTIAKSIREMVRDLQLSILEFKAEFNANVLSVGMNGGASQIQNLGPFLTQMLELPVNKISSLQNFGNVLFERSPAVDAKVAIALGLAVEGLKKPRNPATNFLKLEFAKQNHRLQNMIEKWSKTMAYAVAAVVILFIYTNLRDSFTADLNERTDVVLKSQAKSIAKLSTKNANEAGIRKYIKENKKRALDLKTLANVASMNSALDILKKVNDATPQKSLITLDIRKFDVSQNQVSIEGYVNSQREVSLLQQSLINISKDGKVQTSTSSLPTLANRTAFALTLQADRGVQKVSQ